MMPRRAFEDFFVNLVIPCAFSVSLYLLMYQRMKILILYGLSFVSRKNFHSAF